MSLWKDLEERIIWDFKVGDEFKLNREGYAFVIDVYEGVPKLAFYKIKKYSAECNLIKKQPDPEMLLSAIKKQGGEIKRHGLFSIDDEIMSWVRNELFNDAGCS
ncbi:MAG: DVU0772 family protein [Bacillota bacterium]